MSSLRVPSHEANIGSPDVGWCRVNRLVNTWVTFPSMASLPLAITTQDQVREEFPEALN